MKVSELIAILQKMPQEARVCIRDRDEGIESRYGYDEAKDIFLVAAPNSAENYWDKEAAVIA